MTATPYKIHGRNTDFTYFEGEHHFKNYYEYSDNAPPVMPIQSSKTILKGYSEESNVLNLTSDRRKIYISPIGAFFHIFTDSVGPLLQQYEVDPDVDIIIDISWIKDESYSTNHTKFNENSYTGFFIKALKEAGASVTLIDRHEYSAINIKNVYVNDYEFYAGDIYSSLFNLFKTYIHNPDQKPFRHTYLSRKKVPSRIETFTHPSGEVVTSNDNRSDNEQVLEDYFSSLGYEIVYAEDFETFQDQINYMYQVEKLVSLTGSGLTNSVFMQPGQTIIEIMTPLVIPFPDLDNPYKSILIEDLHHFYTVMAFKKKHTYLAIENQNKGSIEIVDKINSDPKLKRFLQNEKSKRTNPYGWFRKSIR